MSTDVQQTAAEATAPKAPVAKSGKGRKAAYKVDVPEGGFTQDPTTIGKYDITDVKFRCLRGDRMVQSLTEVDFADPLGYWQFQESIAQFVIQKAKTRIEELQKYGSTTEQRVAWNEVGGDAKDVFAAIREGIKIGTFTADMVAALGTDLGELLKAAQESQS